MDYSVIDDLIDSKAEYFQSVSEYIHSNPELAFQEIKSHDFLAGELRKEGFTVTENYLNCKTAFQGAFEITKGGPTICIICEYDALPQVGHACGHNLIAEAGIAAGFAVKRFLEKNPQVKGKVTVLGTPAEESGGGKQVLIESGAFDGVDVALMVHPANTSNEVAPFFIGVQPILVEYFGKAAHAAGFPWEGKNALDGAVTCYNGLSMLRQHLRPNCKVHAMITNGGAAANIVPDYSSLTVYFRAPTLKELDDLEKRVNDCARAGAILSDTEVKVTNSLKYLPLQSNPTLGRLYKKHCESSGMSFDDKEDLGGFVASSDIGNVSWKIPTIQPCFHIDSKGPNHSRDFTEAAASKAAQLNTLITAKAMAKTSADLFCIPEEMAKAKQEFAKRECYKE